MRPRTAQRLLGTSVLLLLSAPLACSSSSSSEPSASPDASTDSATTVDPSDAGAQDDGSTSCTPPVNGQLAAPSGTFQATIVNGGANLTKAAPGTIPCEADFAANSGISLGNNQYTGSFSVTCWGNEGTLYFGLRVSAAAKPKTGDSFPVGHTTAVSGGGGFVSNGQSDLAWEEGPACDTKQDRSKEWNGEAAAGAGGAFVVDSVTGTDLIFHLTETNLTTSTNGLNYKGTGSFKLSGSGTAKVTGL